MHNDEPRGGFPFCPDAPASPIPWGQIEESPLKPWIRRMAETPQAPKWHAEGDVWTHTRMACEELVKMPAYTGLPQGMRAMLFAAALLHDVAKPACTKLVDGEIASPNHAVAGEKLARSILWTEFGFCGTRGKQQFRETVCALVRNHSVPQHVADQRDPLLRLRKIAAAGLLATDFTLYMLSLLAEADIRGRISGDRERQMENLGFFADMASEAGCLEAPPLFSSGYCRYAYFSGRAVEPQQALFDDTWGSVVMLGGLPGTGKDTFYRENLSHLPMVSLDDIRERMGIPPTRPQGAVAAEAKEQARQYLRNRQPFVWNATNLTPMMRAKQVELFHRYGASARLVYLETDWREMLRRNAERARSVPESVLRHMLEELAPPMPHEAEAVRWLCDGGEEQTCGS